MSTLGRPLVVAGASGVGFVGGGCFGSGLVRGLGRPRVSPAFGGFGEPGFVVIVGVGSVGVSVIERMMLSDEK